MDSNSACMMMWNTLAPKCDKQWVQVCIHQLQSNPTTCEGTGLGLSLGGVSKNELQLSTKSIKSLKSRA
jgi:hypothetical protein